MTHPSATAKSKRPDDDGDYPTAQQPALNATTHPITASAQPAIKRRRLGEAKPAENPNSRVRPKPGARVKRVPGIGAAKSKEAARDGENLEEERDDALNVTPTASASYNDLHDDDLYQPAVSEPPKKARKPSAGRAKKGEPLSEAISDKNDRSESRNEGSGADMVEHGAMDLDDEERRDSIQEQAGEPMDVVKGDEIDASEEEENDDDDESVHYDRDEAGAGDDDDTDDDDDNGVSKSFRDNYKWKSGLDNGKPLDTMEKIFANMLEVMAEDTGFQDLLTSGKVLRIGTMCSGTECPIIVMDFIKDLLAKKGTSLRHEHAFSAEIVPMKQAFIQRNNPKVIVFRDCVELAHAVNPTYVPPKLRKWVPKYEFGKATTAYGDKVDIPTGKLDFLVAGFSCVDFSVLNGSKKTLEQRGESGDTLYSIVDFVGSRRPKLVLMENVKNAPWSDAKVQKHNKKKLMGELNLKAKKEKLNRKETEEVLSDENVNRILKEKNENKLTNRGIDALMNEIGYACQLVLLDAKDFYIPQTRQRGYMLCVDSGLFGKDAQFAMEQAKKALRKWGFKAKKDKAEAQLTRRFGGMLGKLEHQCSVSAEQMLLAASEDTTVSVTRIEESEYGKKKVIKWPSVKLKHEQYRDDLFLGHERKLTLWNEADFKLLLDFWTLMPGMTQRVLDTLEIAHLRNVLRGMDDRYYSRLLELSQSVYRNVDTTASGIIPCLTPNGMPWWTTDGRRITGREALLLQGLPVQRMDLSYLTEANMQDLTGNAMTSTVVGAGMLAGVSAFSQYLGCDDAEEAKDDEEIVVPPEEDCELIETFSDPSTSTRLSVGTVKALARQTSALCRCEGEHTVQHKTFDRCRVCDHAACREHSGNLLHDYQEIEGCERKLPSEFESLIKASMPKLIRFSFGGLDVSDFERLLSDTYIKLRCHRAVQESRGVDMEVTKAWEAAMGDLKAALDSTLILKSVTRSSSWEVVYESSHAKLVFQITQHRVQWLLYAKPPAELPLNNTKRVALTKFPIARLLPAADTLMEGTWQLWEPMLASTKVKLVFDGQLVPSFESDRGLVDFANTYVFNSFAIEVDESVFPEMKRISGRWDLKQNCGQAFNSLHVRSSSADLNDSSMFLFFDHQPQHGDPKFHSYVFTEDPKKLPYGIYRQSVAKFSPDFHYPMVQKITIDGSVTYKITNRVEILERAQAMRTTESQEGAESLEDAGDLGEEPQRLLLDADIYVDGRWVDVSELSFSKRGWDKAVHRKLPATQVSWENDSCKARHKIYECKTLVPSSTAEGLQREVWIRISQKNETDVFRRFLPFLAGAIVESNVALGDGWRPNALTVVLCPSCSPQRPAILWAWHGHPNSTKKDQKPIQKPFENPRETFEYGHNLKTRPNAVEAIFRIGSDNFLSFAIGVNPQTLIHRAISLLAVEGDINKITTSWRISTDDRAASVEPFGQYEPLSTENVKLQSYLRAMKDKSKDLRPEQMRSVAWQIEQEERPQAFTEEEIVESRAPRLGLRLLGRAQRQVVKPGGIIASEVGFGKTATVLSLVHHRKDADLLRMKQDMGHTAMEGLIPSKATVIFVPAHLVGQWVGEAHTFLPDKPTKPTVLAIYNIKDLQRMSIRDIQNADVIVIPWGICESETYISDLSQVAGMAPPDISASPRALLCWYQAALQSIKDNVKFLVSASDAPTRFQENIRNQTLKHWDAAKEKEFPVPSTRSTGAKYNLLKVLGDEEDDSADADANDPEPKFSWNQHFGTATRRPKQKEVSSDSKTESIPWDTMKFIVLEMFKFARIVIDEFHYAGLRARTSMASIEAFARWLLSGTPGLSNFSQIKPMAHLLGINLGVDDYSSMSHDDFQVAIADKTATEKFLIYQPPPSPAWIKRRDDLARKFLDQYLRKDKADYGDISCYPDIRLIHQPAAERAAYVQLELALAANQLKILKASNTHSEADKQQHSCVSGYKKGEHALLWRTGYHNYNLLRAEGKAGSITEETESTVCNAIEKIRNSDCEDLQAKFLVTFKKAEVLQHMKAANKAQSYKRFQKRLHANAYGDSKVTKSIQMLLEGAKSEVTSDSWMDFYRKKDDESSENSHLEVYPEGVIKAGGVSAPAATHFLGKVAKKLDMDAQELVKRRRALRIARTVRDIQNQDEENRENVCRACQCPLTTPASIFILWQCGHKVCQACQTSKICPVDGCTARSNPLEIINGQEFTTLDTVSTNDNDQIVFSKYGKKIDTLLGLVKAVKSKDERALVFVQDVNVIKKIQIAFTDNDIKFETLDDGDGSSNTLLRFQEGKSPTTVLILNIGDASAAGSNITIANHVIFFAPYYTEGSDAQQKFAAAMEQAIGRARRFLQTKNVYVYHLITSKTFDVDLYEERTRMVIDDSLHGRQRARHPHERRVTKTPNCSRLFRMVLGRNQS